MRLLNVRSFEFEEFHTGNIPRYVIASHRWSRGQEASFKDVQRAENVDKSGYKKVVGFAEYMKAHVSDVEWLWVDTCCIDKDSSQEVSEAVNSMFRWYSQAELCLAYLADVSTPDIEHFIQSEWFTRGWTLQELLAPDVVVFLTSEWKVAGHKGEEANVLKFSPLDAGRSLERAISSVTKIPVEILRDYGQSRGLTIQDKLAWTSGRTTTREEDMWYCLFGIFDVAIGANYGEGNNRAERRLMREISENSRQNDAELQATAGAPNAPVSLSIRPKVEQPDSRETMYKIGESFFFQQMEDRRDHIHVAYQGTYQWILHPTTNTNARWDNFISWLQDPEPSRRTYWISAKPGAGKSSLVRFLDAELQVNRDMQPWAGDGIVFCVSYYFWSPGNVLQKSLIGLLRTIIYQLYEQAPELVLSCLPLRKKMEARATTTATDISWTLLELRDCIRKFIAKISSSARLFMLVDGLDEVDGDEDNRDELIEFLRNLTTSVNVKLCVSSRRWTIFEDAFARCPQLRLEDLNARDIDNYVRGRLMAQRSFEQMLNYDPSAARLINDVIRKAQGVFLWTRLVVTELTRGIRDGDNYQTLEGKLENMPNDLNAYFAQLIDSIEPYHRREACVLLQIALHDEREFTTLHPLRLLDLIFIQEADHDFALSESRNIYIQSFLKTEELFGRLDSTVRRLSSLCKGLLECYYHGGSTLVDFAIEGGETGGGRAVAAEWEYTQFGSFRTSPRTSSSLPRTLLPVLHQNKYAAMDFRIDFMHRSLRDYLLESEQMQFLAQHTGGLFDARNYLRNARLVEMYMASHAGLHRGMSLGLASYYISTLSVPDFRNDPRCAQHVEAFRPLTASYQEIGTWGTASFWYICHSLRAWLQEQSNFITLAIDFGLTGYLARALTADIVKSKRGRPLLDYALRPRFADFFYFGDVSIGLQYPNPDLVRAILSLGADPNEPVEGMSLWPLFLAFIAEQSALYTPVNSLPQEIRKARTSYFFSLAAMIQSGASPVVRGSAIAGHTMHGMRTSSLKQRTDSFERRWPGLSQKAKVGGEGGEKYAVVDVFECFRRLFGEDIESLKKMVQIQIHARQVAQSSLEEKAEQSVDP